METELWPNLQVLFGGGINAEPYRPVIEKRVGRPMILMDNYNATEGGIFAVTDREKKNRGISAFIVELDNPGIRVGKKENKLGMRASDTCTLVMEDCRIPAGNLLGGEGQGFVNSMKILDGGRISIAALAVGACAPFLAVADVWLAAFAATTCAAVLSAFTIATAQARNRRAASTAPSAPA